MLEQHISIRYFSTLEGDYSIVEKKTEIGISMGNSICYSHSVWEMGKKGVVQIQITSLMS